MSMEAIRLLGRKQATILLPGALYILLGATIFNWQWPALIYAVGYLLAVNLALPEPNAKRIGLVIVLTAPLLLHLVPGFANQPLWPLQPLTPNAVPYQLQLGYDKLLIAISLLPQCIQRDGLICKRPLLLVALFIATILLTLGVAMGLNLVAWQPKIPQLFWQWLAVNLLITCTAEELLFRGELQRWASHRFGAVAGVIGVTLLFGAVHLPFSPGFAVAATVAGLGYGLVYQISGSILAAIALHGLLNATHMLLFTYPLLA